MKILFLSNVQPSACSILLDDSSCELPKRQSSLDVNDFVQIRLSENRQSIPCNLGALILTLIHVDTFDKMWHSFEFALSDELECLARLKSETVSWNTDFVYLPVAISDVQTGAWGRGSREFFQRCAGVFIEEHGRCKASQTAMVEMCGAPIVFRCFSIVLVTIAVAVCGGRRLALIVAVREAVLCWRRYTREVV